MKQHPRDVDYETRLLEDLQDPEEAAAYLEACLEDEDPAIFLLALRQVANAKGMTALANETSLGRASLYKSLSKTGNPELRTLNKLLHAMDMRLSVVPEQHHA